MKRLLFILLVCASHTFAGPKTPDDYSQFPIASQNVRVSIDADGDGSGLILQAYMACLRNTAGVDVVPLGQPANAEIQILSVKLTNKGGTVNTGYAWASATFDPATRVLLDGPNEYVAGSNRDIFQNAASDVQSLNRGVFISLRNQPKN